jgi:putative acetyltransferase
VVKSPEVETRLANATDADGIAAAHLDSIRTIGARFYSPQIVEDWAARISSDRYARAMQGGEVFYIAVGMVNQKPEVPGFPSHRIESGQHRTAVYVRHAASRSGVGSALFKLAEGNAVALGATSIRVDSSLAAIEFYQANGFEVICHGAHQLWSGRSMACVFMKKTLSNHSGASSPLPAVKR